MQVQIEWQLALPFILHNRRGTNFISTFSLQIFALSLQHFKTGPYLALAWTQFCQQNLSLPAKTMALQEAIKKISIPFQTKE
jgi:hypothetical protein